MYAGCCTASSMPLILHKSRPDTKATIISTQTAGEPGSAMKKKVVCLQACRKRLRFLKYLAFHSVRKQEKEEHDGTYLPGQK